MTTVDDTLAALEKAIADHPEADYGDTQQFCPAEPVNEEVLAAAEARIGGPIPPSFRRVLKKYGAFTLGKPDPAHDHLVFSVWAPADWKTGLDEMAEQLGCAAEAEAIAEELGLEPQHVAVLGQQILIGLEGHEDFVGFDVRNRHPETGECSFGLVLFDDVEIEALANEKVTPQATPGFDAWLAKHVARRA